MNEIDELKAKVKELDVENNKLRKAIRLAAEDMEAYQDRLIKLGDKEEIKLGREDWKYYYDVIMSYKDLDLYFNSNRGGKRKKIKEDPTIQNPDLVKLLEDNKISQATLAIYIGCTQTAVCHRMQRKMSDKNKEIFIRNVDEIIKFGITRKNVEEYRGLGLSFRSYERINED